MAKRRIILIVHNVRSCHNVGSLLRTSDGLGIERVYLTGYTPFPELKNDPRLPHERLKISRQISKTALGAERTISWRYEKEIGQVIDSLKAAKIPLAALEQTQDAVNLNEFKAGSSIALMVGSEVGGIDKEVLKLMDIHLQIPMLGDKESFNVSAAASMALYHLRFVA